MKFAEHSIIFIKSHQRKKGRNSPTLTIRYNLISETLNYKLKTKDWKKLTAYKSTIVNTTAWAETDKK